MTEANRRATMISTCCSSCNFVSLLSEFELVRISSALTLRERLQLTRLGLEAQRIGWLKFWLLCTGSSLPNLCSRATILPIMLMMQHYCAAINRLQQHHHQFSDTQIKRIFGDEAFRPTIHCKQQLISQQPASSTSTMFTTTTSTTTSTASFYYVVFFFLLFFPLLLLPSLLYSATWQLDSLI